MAPFNQSLGSFFGLAATLTSQKDTRRDEFEEFISALRLPAVYQECLYALAAPCKNTDSLAFMSNLLLPHVESVAWMDWNIKNLPKHFHKQSS